MKETLKSEKKKRHTALEGDSRMKISSIFSAATVQWT